jgi:Tol biopolymer transport system component/DNA-binding SARP family transcriptional activator
MPTDTRLRLDLLGSGRFRLGDGKPQSLTGLPLAVLAYLALSGRPVPRDHLAVLFWPGSERAKALHGLRQTLSRLRATLPVDVIRGDGSLRIDEAALTTDVSELFVHLKAGRLPEALELWRGPLLEGFRRPKCWELEDWLDQERTRLERTLSAAVVAESRALLGAGLAPEAVSLLATGRTAVPGSHVLATLQVEALAAAGAVAEAEGAYATLDLEMLKDGGRGLRELIERARQEALRRTEASRAAEAERSATEGVEAGMSEAPGAGRPRPGPGRTLAAVLGISLVAFGITTLRPDPTETLSSAYPDQSMLFCSRRATDGAAPQLFRMDFDGNRKHRITADVGCIAVVTPQGHILARIEQEEGGARLARYVPDPANPIAEWRREWVATGLRDPVTNQGAPSVTPEGTAVFSALGPDGNRDIYALDPGATEARRLTTHPAPDWHPAVVADRDEVVFRSDRSGDGDLYVVALDGGPAEQLTDHPSREDAVWPRGDSLLFVRGRGSGSEDGLMELVLLDRASGEETLLTDNDWNDYRPAWSPDGGHLCWQSERLGHYESNIVVLDLTSGRRRTLVDTPGRDAGCAWSPDGRGITFVSIGDGDEEIYLQSLEGGAPLNLTRHPASEEISARGHTLAW